MKPGNLCDSHKQSDLLPLDIMLIMDAVGEKTDLYTTSEVWPVRPGPGPTG